MPGIPALGEVEAGGPGVQGQHEPHSKFEDSQGSMISCFKRERGQEVSRVKAAELSLVCLQQPLFCLQKVVLSSSRWTVL